MSDAERLRALLFVGLVATTYVLAARGLVRALLRRRGWLRDRPSRAAIWSHRVVYALALVGLACIGYGFAVEPYWPSVTHVRLRSRKLAAGARPVRIVQISDLHCDATPRLEGRLPGLIGRERPDLIVFTGDAINTPAGLPVFRRCLGRIAALAPTFAVRGNWDTWYWSDLDLFGGTGARDLKDDGARIEVAGTSVYVAGAPAWDDANSGSALAGARAGDFTIFLYHYPDAIFSVAERGADLYCAGHTHGGQVALPFYGALVTLSRYGKRFESGLHRVGRTWLYVNRGIGMEGDRAPRVRFCARPEITVFEIEPER